MTNKNFLSSSLFFFLFIRQIYWAKKEQEQKWKEKNKTIFYFLISLSLFTIFHLFLFFFIVFLLVQIEFCSFLKYQVEETVDRIVTGNLQKSATINLTGSNVSCLPSGIISNDSRDNVTAQFSMNAHQN